MKIVARRRFITSTAPISNNLVTFAVRAYLVHTGGFGIETICRVIAVLISVIYVRLAFCYRFQLQEVYQRCLNR